MVALAKCELDDMIQENEYESIDEVLALIAESAEVR